MSRQSLLDRAVSGSQLNAYDFVSPSRGKKNVLTYRAAWMTADMDGRAADSIRRCVHKAAREIANGTGRPVEIYAKGGWMVDQIEPNA